MTECGNAGGAEKSFIHPPPQIGSGIITKETAPILIRIDFAILAENYLPLPQGVFTPTLKLF